MLEYISNYSLYACEQEMRQGFISQSKEGHRVGLSGQAIMENGKVKEPEIHFFGEYPCGA